MKKLSTSLAILLTLSGCSGWNFNLSDEKNAHFRTLATVSTQDQDKEDLAFAVRKRDKCVMAEKTFYEDGAFSASFTGGRHREHKWMSGISLNYAF